MLRDAANFRVLEEIVQHAKLFRAVLHHKGRTGCARAVPMFRVDKIKEEQNDTQAT